MIYIGMDASSQGFGIAIMENRNLLFKTTLLQDKKLTEWEHLKSIYEYLNQITEKYKPQIIITEDTYVGFNAKTVKLLNTIRGLVHATSFNYNIPLEIIHTMTMKSVISKTYPSYTRMQKEKLKAFTHRIILNEYKMPLGTTGDETDAIALVLTYLKKGVKK